MKKRSVKKMVKTFFKQVMKTTGHYEDEDLMESDIFIGQLNEKDFSIKATAEFDIMNGEGCLCFEITKNNKKEYVYIYDIVEKKETLKEILRLI